MHVTVVVVDVERFNDVGGEPSTKKLRGDCIVPATTMTHALPIVVAGQEGWLLDAEIMESADDAALHTIVRVSVGDGVEGSSRDKGALNHGQEATIVDTSVGAFGSAPPLASVGVPTVRTGIEQPTSVT